MTTLSKIGYLTKMDFVTFTCKTIEGYSYTGFESEDKLSEDDQLDISPLHINDDSDYQDNI